MRQGESRCLAIDWGEARLGLALSDPLGLAARPLDALRRVGARKDLRTLEELVREHEVRTVVVGLPLRLSGEEGRQAQAARDFARQLARRLSGVRVRLWDERWTTIEAQRTLTERGVKGARKKRERVDSWAAALILQAYLDAEREQPQ